MTSTVPENAALNLNPLESPRGLDWSAIVAIVAVGAVLIFASLRCICNPDFWWQLATGRYVVENGWPGTDAFSFTVADHAWIEMRWLYCVTLYGLSQTLGFGSTVIAKCLCLALTFGLAASIFARRRNLVLTCAVLLLAVFASRQRFFVRPELATFLFMAIFMVIIERYRCRQSRMIYLCPFLQVVWVNSHTVFVMGPLLLGALGLTELIRLLTAPVEDREAHRAELHRFVKLVVVLVATLLACLVNPYGLDGAVFPWQLYTQLRGTAFKNAITEFVSPFAGSYPAVNYYIALIILCGLSGVLNYRRLDPYWTIICILTLYLSTTAIRNLPLFCIVAVPFIIQNLSACYMAQTRFFRRWAVVMNRCGAVALFLAAVYCCWSFGTNRFYVTRHDNNGFGMSVEDHCFPVRAVEFMRRHDLTGPIFNTMVEGSYLTHAGMKVFFDPRLEVYAEPFFVRWVKTLTVPQAFEDAAEEFDIRVVLMVNDRFKLINWLMSSPRWNLVYLDECSVVFARADAGQHVEPLDPVGDGASVVAELRKWLPPPTPYEESSLFDSVSLAAPYLKLGQLFFMLDCPELAEEFLRDAVVAYPKVRTARFFLAQIYKNRRDLPAAVDAYEAEPLKHGGDVKIDLWASQLYLDVGRPEDAVLLLERVLRAGVRGPGDLQQAIGCCQQVIERMPDECLPYELIVQFELMANRPDVAAVWVQKGLAICPNSATLRRLGPSLGVLP